MNDEEKAAIFGKSPPTPSNRTATGHSHSTAGKNHKGFRDWDQDLVIKLIQNFDFRTEGGEINAASFNLWIERITRASC